MYKMADIVWYTYSFEGRIVVVLCGVLMALAGLSYRKLGV